MDCVLSSAARQLFNLIYRTARHTETSEIPALLTKSMPDRGIERFRKRELLSVSRLTGAWATPARDLVVASRIIQTCRSQALGGHGQPSATRKEIGAGNVLLAVPNNAVDAMLALNRLDAGPTAKHTTWACSKASTLADSNHLYKNSDSAKGLPKSARPVQETTGQAAAPSLKPYTRACFERTASLPIRAPGCHHH